MSRVPVFSFMTSITHDVERKGRSKVLILRQFLSVLYVSDRSERVRVLWQEDYWKRKTAKCTISQRILEVSFFEWGFFRKTTDILLLVDGLLCIISAFFLWSRKRLGRGNETTVSQTAVWETTLLFVGVTGKANNRELVSSSLPSKVFLSLSSSWETRMLMFDMQYTFAICDFVVILSPCIHIPFSSNIPLNTIIMQNSEEDSTTFVPKLTPNGTKTATEFLLHEKLF